MSGFSGHFSRKFRRLNFSRSDKYSEQSAELVLVQELRTKLMWSLLARGLNKSSENKFVYTLDSL